MGSVGVSFLWEDNTYDLGVGDFLSTIHGDVFVLNNVEGVSAFDTLISTIGARANALTETTHFIGVGFITNLGEFGMILQLVIFDELSFVDVNYHHRPLGNEGGWKATAS